MQYDKEKWIYESESQNQIRYILGTKGEKPLLCFGINPSTAKPEKLDNTLKSVERLSKNNGYDSWIMMNVYPQRATDPNNIHTEIDSLIHKTNLRFINDIVLNGKVDIWAAWGTLIEKRPFLINCLIDIYNLTKELNCKWLSIGKKSKFGHPHHPLYLNSQEQTETFSMKEYITNLNNLLIK